MKSPNKTLVETKQSAATVMRRCSVNKVFRKITQNYQENTCAGVFFNEVSVIEIFGCFCQDQRKNKQVTIYTDLLLICY